MIKLICLLTAVFMAILDVAVANIALPLVRKTLHASGPELQMVTMMYVAAYALLLIACARLGKMLSYRRVFMNGLALFTLASLLCGLAVSPLMLIGARFAQGIGAALMMPQVLSLIQQLFTGHERARALSWYAAVIAGGAIVGQIAGGLIVSANLFHLSWRPVFLINVPIGIALYGMCWLALPQDGAMELHWRRLDVPGMLLLAGILASAVAPILLGRLWLWAIVPGALGAAALLRREQHLAKHDGAPLLPAALFRQRQFSAGVVSVLLAMAGYGGMLFLLTIFVQEGLRRSALATGMAFLPSAVAFGAASLNWRRLPARLHRLLPAAGLLITSAALVGLALSVRSAAISVGMETAIFGFGLGMGLSFSPVFAHILASVPPANAPDASGILTTANQLGQTLGVALFGALLLQLMAHGPGQAAAITALAMAASSLVAAGFAAYATKTA